MGEHNDFPAYLTFDQIDDEPTIEPGATLRMRFRGITYCQVYDTETEKRIAQGNIFVQ